MAPRPPSWRYEIFMFLAVSTSFLVLFDAFSADRDTRRSAPMRPGPSPMLTTSTTDGRRRRPLLDLNGFEYVIDSGACEGPRRHTPIVVHSHVGHFERRRAIRQSYPRTVLDRLGFRHVFMVGLPSSGDRDGDLQARLLRESSRHGDVVQGNFREAYRNLTYKHTMGLTWFAKRCPRSDYMVKMDDDIAVNVFKLNAVLGRADNRDLAGCVIAAKPIRDESNKWYVSRAEFAGDAYPPFLSGWLYAARAASVPRLLRAIGEHEKYFWIDDLYVTGILAERAGLAFTDLRPDFETDPGPIHCCVHKRQRCDFLAAPTGDDDTLLQRYAEQLTRCKATNSSCDVFRKSKLHHNCLDLWKKKQPLDTRMGRPSIEILNWN
ncbi:beta-1,3-galactosyltransferase 5 [Acyrthosiphon pisum]|uniref:Hexosyltransferase n=1 Tax=Acyrthosiphon pisum TaxID=7029 RepID=A0A8R2B6Z7_ACYPI|nr:beta-1,3-galactosyltransferase 5 [Acyrthosiphon pisum]|eukprot:XP_008184332.1 PREDICTED: beta-1,3-galactosyltransferase 5-like [Acyrthosiphon pisum]